MKRALLVLALWAFGPGAAAAAPEEEAKKQMEEGVAFFQQEEYAKAILAFTEALQILPDAAGPHRELGKCFHKIADFDRAIHHYTEYLARRPDAAERDTIEKLFVTLRASLPTQRRGFFSLSDPPGAVVYALTETGETRGIGVVPLDRHPLETRFTKIQVVPAQSDPREAAIQLTVGQALSLSSESFTAPTVTAPDTTLPGPTLPPEEDPTPKDTPKSAVGAGVTLGLSGASLAAGAAFGVLFFQTVQTMEDGLLALEAAPPSERPLLQQDLQRLDALARRQLLATRVGLGAAVVTGGLGVFLLIRAKQKPKEKSAWILPTQNGVQAVFSF